MTQVDGSEQAVRRSTAELVVSVGTDHHQFDRLIQWIDEWRDLYTDKVVVVQAGTSTPSRHGDSRDLIPHGDLLEMFREAVVVVSHGGPSTVMDARMSGRLPVVVPRDPGFGEHVDEHQLRFAEHLDHHGVAVVVRGREALFDAIDQAFKNPAAFTVATDSQTAEGVARFGEAVDRLLGSRAESGVTGGIPNAPVSEPADHLSTVVGQQS